ncbi:MAG TPA: hypothetical protein PKC45_13825 [Gemmatales bacterium]|nr:hypothetical protein [Gemmatales bacterium]
MTTWTLTLLALFAPAAAQETLSVQNARCTMGLFGPAMAAGRTVLPGDVVTLTFDVDGLKRDSEGRCRFSTTLQVEDSQGKVHFADTSDSPTVGSLQGVGRVRHAVQVTIALNQTAGAYKLKLTVTDHLTKKDAKHEHTITVGQPEFGLVRTQMMTDPNSRQPSAPVGIVGQVLSISTVAVGFQFGGQGKEGHLSVEVMLQSADGKTLTEKPVKAEFANIPGGTTYLPLRFDVPLQKAGNYTLVVKATDQVTSKTATLSMPIRILETE